MSQRLDVSQNVVRLPKTTIQSSAMNVSIEGDYHFDEVMDYTLALRCATSAHPLPTTWG